MAERNLPAIQASRAIASVVPNRQRWVTHEMRRIQGRLFKDSPMSREFDEPEIFDGALRIVQDLLLDQSARRNRFDEGLGGRQIEHKTKLLEFVPNFVRAIEQNSMVYLSEYSSLRGFDPLEIAQYVNAARMIMDRDMQRRHPGLKEISERFTNRDDLVGACFQTLRAYPDESLDVKGNAIMKRLFNAVYQQQSTKEIKSAAVVPVLSSRSPRSR